MSSEETSEEDAESTEQSVSKIYLPRRYRKVDIGDYEGQTLERLLNIEWQRSGVFLWGKPGRGKTQVACALLRHRAAQLKPNRKNDIGIFAHSGEIFDEIKKTFDGRGSAYDAMQKYKTIPVLVIDDLARTISEWAWDTMYNIIWRREAEMLDTIVTSNCTLEEIAEFEPRIASRLGGFENIEITGPDRRIRR